MAITERDAALAAVQAATRRAEEAAAGRREALQDRDEAARRLAEAEARERAASDSSARSTVRSAEAEARAEALASALEAARSSGASLGEQLRAAKAEAAAQAAHHDERVRSLDREVAAARLDAEALRADRDALLEEADQQTQLIRTLSADNDHFSAALASAEARARVALAEGHWEAFARQEVASDDGRIAPASRRQTLDVALLRAELRLLEAVVARGPPPKTRPTPSEWTDNAYAATPSDAAGSRQRPGGARAWRALADALSLSSGCTSRALTDSQSASPRAAEVGSLSRTPRHTEGSAGRRDIRGGTHVGLEPSTSVESLLTFLSDTSLGLDGDTASLRSSGSYSAGRSPAGQTGRWGPSVATTSGVTSTRLLSERMSRAAASLGGELG